MKKIMELNLKILVLFLSLVMVISACKKDDDDDNNDDNNNNNEQTTNPNTYPEFNDGNGVMVAIKSVSFVSTLGYDVQTTIGLAVAAFPDATNAGTLLDAGTVSCEAKDLTKYENNSYLYSPTATDYDGINHDDDVNWEVTGNSTNGIDAISATISIGWPTVSKIKDNPTSVDISSDFTLEANETIENADSVIFALYGSTGDPILYTAAGNTSSHTFTVAEMSSLSGSGFVQIVAYKYTSNTYGTKNMYFVNEAVVTNMVDFE